MITLKDMLSEKFFQSVRPITNEKTLTHEILSADIVEAKDVANFTLPKGLLLTTAMDFKNDQNKLIPFIDSLVDINTAGLCIKTSRFLKKVDPEVIEYANKKNFALLEVPQDISLSLLLYNIFDYILGTQAQNLVHALEIQDHYSSLFIDGANPHQILDELSTTINAPTILINPFLREVATSSYFNRSTNPVSFYMEQIVGKIDNRLMKYQSLDITDYNGKETQLKIYPIKGNSYFPYYLAVIDPNYSHYPITKFAIDQSILVLSFILYKNNQIEKSMIRIQNSFFSSLIFGNHMGDRNANEFFEQGINYGIIRTNYYQVILCDTQVTIEDSQYRDELGVIIYLWILERTIPDLKHGIVFYRDKTKQTSLLLQQPIDNLEDILEKSAKNLEKMLNIKVHFGIGNPVDHPYDLDDSYFESVKALELDNNDYIKRYSQSGIMTLFNEDSIAIHYFIKSQLHHLAYSTDKVDLELVETLKSFLENQCSIVKTAQELDLHRNTIIYRIKNFESMMNVDLKDAQTNLNIRLALELLDLHG